MILSDFLQKFVIENHEFLLLLDSSNGLDIYIQLILTIGTILIGVIAFIISFLAFNSNRKAIKRNNIHSEIAFYNKQIESYYIPISNALRNINEAINEYLSYFEELNINDLKTKDKLIFHQSKIMGISKAENNLRVIVQEYEYLNISEINQCIFKYSKIKNELEIFQSFLDDYSKIGVGEAIDFICSDSNINYNYNSETVAIGPLNTKLNYNHNFNDLILGYVSIIQFWINVEGMLIKKSIKDETFVISSDYLGKRMEILLELIKKSQIITSSKIPIANRCINLKIKQKYRQLNINYVGDSNDQ